MRDIVICEPVRTPIGRFGGALKDLTAADLGVTAMRAVMERTSVDPGAIDEVILGHCNASSDGPSLGRIVALDAGLPTTVAGYHLDRRCGSGLQAIISAAAHVQMGVVDLVAAGGAESMSNAPFYTHEMRWGARPSGVHLHDSLTRARVTAGGKSHPVAGGMIETAENLRRDYQISREAQDALALESQRKAAAAMDAGRFDEEIVPVDVPGRRGQVTLVDTDEHPRRDASPEGLAKLSPLMSATDPEATVTAGNASGQNDAAAICLVTHAEHAAKLGLRPIVRMVSCAVAGVPAETMGIGPVPATAKALRKAGITLEDLGLIELNEAFAAQTLAVLHEWGVDAHDERLNVNGSGISLGHPVGATGARILATMAYEMRRRGTRYGLETMCIGGGQGLAAVFELVE